MRLNPDRHDRLLKKSLDDPSQIGSTPSRVGDFGLNSYRVKHGGEDFEAHVLLVG